MTMGTDSTRIRLIPTFTDLGRQAEKNKAGAVLLISGVLNGLGGEQTPADRESSLPYEVIVETIVARGPERCRATCRGQPKAC